MEEFFKKQRISKNAIKITLAGVAFKGQPETDDLRGTMAKPIYDQLKQRFLKSNIKIFDPIVKSKHIKELFSSEVSTNLENSFEDTTLFVIANNHPLFSSMPISNLSDLMKKPGLYLIFGIILVLEIFSFLME